MIRINLIPKDYIDRERKRSTTAVVGAVVAVAISVVGAVSLMVTMKSKALATQVNTLQGRITQLEAIAREVDQLESKKQQIDSKNNVVTGLLVGRMDYPKVMQVVVESMPQGQIWLTGMNTSKTAEGYDVSLQANAVNVEAVIRWLERLENISEVTKISLGGISNSDTQVTFPIKFTVVPLK